MIPISALKDLYVALPNSYITEPVHHNNESGSDGPNMVSLIKDSKEKRIGSINWQSGIISIFDEYEYADEAVESIGKENFNRLVSHFDAETDMPDGKEHQKRLELFLKEHSDDSNEEIADLLYG